MSEALLVAPLLGAFIVTEFVMTMSAEDFQSFIISYFIESALVVCSRVYIGPLVEKIEALTQLYIIKLCQKSDYVKCIFKTTLIKQLAGQMQLMSLNEYNSRKQKEKADREEGKKVKVFNWQLEKGEGMEALLGSVLTYASYTQALFLIPGCLAYIILFANETKIPQLY